VFLDAVKSSLSDDCSAGGVSCMEIDYIDPHLPGYVLYFGFFLKYLVRVVILSGKTLLPGWLEEGQIDLIIYILVSVQQMLLHVYLIYF